MSRIAEHPFVRTVLAVQKRYKADAADQLAAAIGFFGFLSLVPLLLLAVAAAGFVYADPDEQARVALTLTQALPGFEATLGDGEADTGVAALVDTVVRNRQAFGLVGILTLLLTGLRVVGSGMAATRIVFRGEVVSGVLGWVRKLVSMVVLGVAALLAVAGSSLVGFAPEALPRPVTVALALAAAFVFDLLLFLAAYRMLSTTTSMRIRQLLPGAILAAVGWAVLKTLGATYVRGQVDSANALYGALGGVIALLLLLYLAGRLYLYGAELSAVLVEDVDGALPSPAEVTDDPAAEQVADGPPPIPAAVRGSPTSRSSPSWPAGPSPTPGMRARLDAADKRLDRQRAATNASQQARTAIAFGLAAGALAAGWRLLGPDRGRR